MNHHAPPPIEQLFHQTPPVLNNSYHDDPLLQDLLLESLPTALLAEFEPALVHMGELASGELYQMQLADRLNEPTLTQWDAWGRRIDQIQLTDVWQRAAQLAAEYGVVAHGYQHEHGPHARLHQFAMAYLFSPSTDIYGCPLAMSDGAATSLLQSGNQQLIDRALPRLLSRDPQHCWTSGQWMTETSGGSDVSGTETTARQDDNGQWRLYGRKWFTSAASSEMTLTLARPEGAPEGSKGLAMFYLEPRNAQGHLQNIEILRLKDKLGTRKLPTAELWLKGAPAEPVDGLDRGVAKISPMLTITRTWNAVTAAALLSRGLALARSYAHQRRAFGHPLQQLPLHRSTLARLHTLQAAVFQLAFLQVRLLGQVEHDATEQADLLRLVTPVTKLATAKQCVAGLSEVIESFGGAGYVENTGLPMLLRDAQVLPIWEGTTNVLSLDLLRAMQQSGGLQPVRDYLKAAETALDSHWQQHLHGEIQQMEDWLTRHDNAHHQAGARHLAFKLAYLFQLTELLQRAQHSTAQQAARYRAMAHLIQREQRVTLPADFNSDDTILG